MKRKMKMRNKIKIIKVHYLQLWYYKLKNLIKITKDLDKEFLINIPWEQYAVDIYFDITSFSLFSNILSL